MPAGFVFVMSVAACADPSQIDREHVSPGDPVIGLLRKGIAQLNVNINPLSRRMNDVQQTSADTDRVLIPST